MSHQSGRTAPSYWLRLQLVLGWTIVIALSIGLNKCAFAQPAPTKGPAIFYEPITVIGMATNAESEPIAGAKIYLASVRFRQLLLAETVTDAQGNYRFEDVQLPVEQSDRPGAEDHGVFEVFGSAEGYSTTWRGQRWYYPDRRPPGAGGEIDQGNDPDHFVGDRPIRQNLIFRLPAPLSGTVVDENDEPIAGTKVVLFNASPVSIDGYDGPVKGDTIIGKEDFTALYLSRVVPADMRLRVTDEQGRFSFDNARAETRYRIFVTPPGFGQRQIYAIASAAKSRQGTGKGVRYDGMKLVFRRRYPSQIKVVYGDTGEPAKNVYVNFSGDESRASKITDAKGQFSVSLPTGKYKVGYRTEYGTPYYSRHSREGRIVHHVRDSNENPLEIRLERVATFRVTVLSDPVARPIEGVDLWVKGGDYQRDYLWRSWKPPNISSTESPRTDKDGKLRLFLPEGTYRIGAGDQFTPANHVSDNQGIEVEAKAGETKDIVLKIKRRGAR